MSFFGKDTKKQISVCGRMWYLPRCGNCQAKICGQCGLPIDTREEFKVIEFTRFVKGKSVTASLEFHFDSSNPESNKNCYKVPRMHFPEYWFI